MMWPMDIDTRAEFAATPEAVFTMLTDKAYLEEVCVASHASRYDVAVNGQTTKVSRHLPAPESAARFTGPEIQVVEEISWGPAAADGSRTGTIDLTVPGQPMQLRGSVNLYAHGTGTIAQLSGELKVTIPLLGKKMEQNAAPAILEGFRVQETVGKDWLAR